MPSGCVLKCRLVEHKTPDFEVFLRYNREREKIYDCDLNLYECYVLEFRIWLSRRLGLPLTTFRLKMSANMQPQAVDLYDDRLLNDYFAYFADNGEIGAVTPLFYLETWQPWDILIRYAMKGFTTKVVECLSADEFIKQYQMQVILYIAAFHGHTNLADMLITMGARCDRPTGEVFIFIIHLCVYLFHCLYS